MKNQSNYISINGKDYLILPVNFVEAVLKKVWETSIGLTAKNSWCDLSAQIYRFSFKEGFIRQNKILILPNLMQILKSKIDNSAREDEEGLPF